MTVKPAQPAAERGSARRSACSARHRQRPSGQRLARISADTCAPGADQPVTERGL